MRRITNIYHYKIFEMLSSWILAIFVFKSFYKLTFIYEIMEKYIFDVLVYIRIL